MPLSDLQVSCTSTSIGGTPVATYVRSPCKGLIVKVAAVTHGAITTADASIAVAIGATAVTGGTITVAFTGSAAGQEFSAVPTGANVVNEGDVISFTPSLASGSNIVGSFYAIIRRD